MRTTLTLDRDVAARLNRLRKRGPFRKIVNDALRIGLEEIEAQASRLPFMLEMEPVASRPRLANLDNVAEVLSVIEGEEHR